MELIKPQKQKVWKWPAATNFTMGGLGTGLYLLAWLANVPQKEDWLALYLKGNGDWLSLAIQSAAFKLLPAALVALGFLALTTEAGRPQRGINLFRHLRRSWMSRETLAFAIFAPLAGIDWLFPNVYVRILGALAALALMFCQGMILYRARGVTAWNHSLMPAMFLTSGLASGGGVWLVAASVSNQPVGVGGVWIVLVALALNLALWIAYLTRGRPDLKWATQELRQGDSLAVVVGLGHLVPAFLLLFTLFADKVPLLGISAGLCLIAGAFTQKFGIVLRAGYLRAIVLGPALKFNQRFAPAE